MVSFEEKAKIKKAGNLNKVVVMLLQLYVRTYVSSRFFKIITIILELQNCNYSLLGGT